MNSKGMTILEMTIASAIGIMTTLVIGASVNQMLRQQKEVSTVVSSEAGWGEVVAHILKHESVVQMAGTISPALRACLDGRGTNCTSLRSPAGTGTLVDMTAQRVTPFFGDKSGCTTLRPECPMERRLERSILCSSAQSCTIQFKLSLFNQNTLVKAQTFPVTLSNSGTSALDFASCQQKPVGVDYQTNRIICANNAPVTCNGLSVVGVGQGQCGNRANTNVTSSCELNVTGGRLQYTLQSQVPTRLSWACRVTGANVPDLSGVRYSSGQGQGSWMSASDLAALQGRSGWTINCEGTVSNENLEPLTGCSASYSQSSGTGSSGGGGPPGPSGPPGSGGSTMGGYGNMAYVSGTGSSFQSSLGALGGSGGGNSGNGNGNGNGGGNGNGNGNGNKN